MRTTKMLKLVAVTMTAWVMAIGCGMSKVSTVADRKPKNPFGDTFEAPCQVYDTPQKFAATGIFRGSSYQRGEVQKNALLAAQELIRLKMQHAYKGMVSEYSSSIGNNKGNDVERKMTSAGDRIIDKIINETSQSCVRWGGVEDDGHITCYTAIEIPKGEVAAEITKEVADKLTQEEKDRIGFNEQEYRKEMAKRFEDYKENH